MIFNPQSNILIMNGINFLMDYTHVLDFPNLTSQQAFFNSKVKYNLANYNFIRKDEQIKINMNIEDLYDCNYLAYKNKDKWIYCFITNKEYISGSVTAINIKTDIWQTFLFNYELKPSFVLREHTTPSNPTLLDEGFDLGSEYIQYNKQLVYKKEDYWLMLIGAIKQRKIVQNGKTDSSGKVIEVVEVATSTSNIPAVIHGVPYQILMAPIETQYLQLFLPNLSGSNALLGVVKVSKKPNMTMKTIRIPYITSDFTEALTSQIEVIDTGFNENDGVAISTVGQGVTQTYPTYEPTGEFNACADENFRYYPYSYSMLTDYVSEPLIVKHEYLNGLTFKAAHCYSTEPSERYWIEGYCGDTGGKVHNITNTSVISLPLANDNGALFWANNRNQVAQDIKNNKLNTLIGVGTSIGAVGGGVATQNPMMAVGGLYGGITSIAKGEAELRSEMARIQDISNQPESIKTWGKVGNQNAFGINQVDYISFTVSDKVKQRIGSYWHQYGYKCLEMKVPNTKSRSVFNYVQTANCNIMGDLDSTDLIELKNIFDKGVTIWHDGSKYLNYKFANGVV